jgi:hypothetical protein
MTVINTFYVVKSMSPTRVVEYLATDYNSGGYFYWTGVFNNSTKFTDKAKLPNLKNTSYLATNSDVEYLEVTTNIISKFTFEDLKAKELAEKIASLEAELKELRNSVLV